MTEMGAIQPISGSRRNFGKPPNAAVLVRGGERLCRVERGHEPEPLVLDRLPEGAYCSGLEQHGCIRRVTLQFVPIEAHAEAGRFRNGQMPVLIEREGRFRDAVHIRTAANEFHQFGIGQRCGELKVCSQAQCGIPAMADIADAEVICHPRNSPLLTDAADLGNVRLHNVERAARKPGQERLSSCQHFPAGDEHRAHPTKVAVIVDGILPG